MSDLRDIFTKLESAEAEAKARIPDPAPEAAPQSAPPGPAAPDPENRRPISSRNSRFAQSAARRLAESDITPNQISQASMACGALGLLLLWGAGATAGPLQAMALILAALTMQARLICNLLDGMVAVEGGKTSPTGSFWNEAPDRVADVLFLWGAGLAAGQPALGLAAAALAIGTAYIRELGRAEGFKPDFRGPMAKPHRMAALTAGCLAAALLPWGTAMGLLTLTLWIVILGTLGTILRRSHSLLQAMNAR
ncbi:CDP-alcohol phosphatidyltransferase family protein [Gemmobacter sp.]|uniref:CDP-alcohol phosphatidyltransferase family protein n=1 Tax=Gemmobacter sp. TaxID=1898957 RepID=UPI0025C2D659|nr:CDP-alcohol phosphatidyltransferase family protein [Gemmobacter sp.]